MVYAISPRDRGRLSASDEWFVDRCMHYISVEINRYPEDNEYEIFIGELRGLMGQSPTKLIRKEIVQRCRAAGWVVLQHERSFILSVPKV